MRLAVMQTSIYLQFGQSAFKFNSLQLFICSVNRTYDNQQPLRKKGRGHLIHNSDFIEEVNGRLVTFNNDGTVAKSAQKIIFPGSNGDPYWDCNQLIEQVKNSAIPVFEEAHPGCQALFIFDQSSAHAALSPDAL